MEFHSFAHPYRGRDFLTRKTWRAAGFLFLHGGTWFICIGAEHATVSAFVNKRCGTRFTGVDQLAKGRRHHDALLMLTCWIGAGKGCQESIAVHFFTIS